MQQAAWSRFPASNGMVWEREGHQLQQDLHSSRISIHEMDEHKLSLDQIIKTMDRTGLDMQPRYRETSLAGSALNVIEC